MDRHQSHGNHGTARAVPDGWLASLCASRFLATLAFMAYAAMQPRLIEIWHMSAAQAGTVAGVLSMSYGVSQFATGWCADRLGARRVYLWSLWLSAAAALVFAIVARSYPLGLVAIALVGLAQGGTYGPAMMLVAEQVPPSRRGSAMGWLIASAPLGYAASLGVAALAVAVTDDYRVAFFATAAGPVTAVIVGWLGLQGTGNVVRRRPTRRARWRRPSRSVVVLTTGYTAHAWEYLGMAAWIPTFAVSVGSSRSGWVGSLAPLLAVGLHVSGAVASVSSGSLSDRLGRRRMLVGFAAAGAACSFAAGSLTAAPVVVLTVFVGVYGFAAVGDSGVLSAAITEAAPDDRLGAVVAVRSLLGFGAGAIAPVVFGAVLDAGRGDQWVAAFAVLGVGGLFATVSAALLPSASPPRATHDEVSGAHHDLRGGP